MNGHCLIRLFGHDQEIEKIEVEPESGLVRVEVSDPRFELMLAAVRRAAEKHERLMMAEEAKEKEA
jgi:hypothetical protein